MPDEILPTYLSQVKCPDELMGMTEVDIESQLISSMHPVVGSKSLALVCAKRLVELNSCIGTRWELLGEVCMTISNEEMQIAAAECFVKAIRLDSEGCLKAYWYLGQMNEGSAALTLYQRGLSNAAVLPDSDKNVGEFLAAILELYMTDLCDEPHAEQSCRDIISQYCGNESFSFQLQAGIFFTIIHDFESAIPITSRLCEIVEAGIEMIENGNADVDDLPDYELQLSLARLCNDLNWLDRSIIILKSLLSQNEDDDRVYHRLAICYVQKGEWDEALDYINECLQIVGSSAEDDLLSELRALKNYIKKKGE